MVQHRPFRDKQQVHTKKTVMLQPPFWPKIGVFELQGFFAKMSKTMKCWTSKHRKSGKIWKITEKEISKRKQDSWNQKRELLFFLFENKVLLQFYLFMLFYWGVFCCKEKRTGEKRNKGQETKRKPKKKDKKEERKTRGRERQRKSFFFFCLFWRPKKVKVRWRKRNTDNKQKKPSFTEKKTGFFCLKQKFCFFGCLIKKTKSNKKNKKKQINKELF